MFMPAMDFTHHNCDLKLDKWRIVSVCTGAQVSTGDKGLRFS